MMIYEDLKGKKALVTGSSSGIGAATAVMFAQQGCFVGVHYFKTKQGCLDTLRQVKKFSNGVLLKADIRNQSQVNKMVLSFARSAGGIDILINNAGDLIDRQPFQVRQVRARLDEAAHAALLIEQLPHHRAPDEARRARHRRRSCGHARDDKPPRRRRGDRLTSGARDVFIVA